MKGFIGIFVLLGLAHIASASFSPPDLIGKVKAIRKSGIMSMSGTILIDTFSISSSTPTLQLGTYVRQYGYTKAASYTATGMRISGTVSNSPQVSISGFTDTTVSLVISQQNTAVVSILGINVLSGLPLIAPSDPQNIKIVLSAYLY